MSPYEFLQAHVYEVETVVVLDDDITDGLNHDDDDLYDPSYEMDPFNISTSVNIIQTHVSKSIPCPVMNEKACENQDKWLKINYKTKDVRDQIDDKYKSVKLSYTKSPSSFPFPSTPPSKPPFPPKQSHDFNLHEITAYEFLQVYTHELEPDPSPDEAIIEEPSILNHDLLEDKQWGEVPEPESSFDEVGDFEQHIIVQHLGYFQCQDGNLFDDIFYQCILDGQTTEPLQEIVFYDAHEIELGLPPEDYLPVPTPSGPKILTKCSTDDNNVRAHMSGGESCIHTNMDKSKLVGTPIDGSNTGKLTGLYPGIIQLESSIHNGILNDRSNIDKSKLAGMSDTTGTGKPIKGVDLELPHPPDGIFKDRSNNGINTGMLTKGNKPPPPPEPPPTFFNICQNLNQNGRVNQSHLPKDIPIPKTRYIWDPGTILHCVTTPELTNATSFLIYDYKVIGLWGDAPKDEITFYGVRKY